MVSCDKQVLNRLKRAEGQLRGIQKMVTEEQACVDVITQLSAVRSSIDRIMGIIVAVNLKDCFENPSSDKEFQAHQIEKAVQLIIKK